MGVKMKKTKKWVKRRHRVITRIGDFFYGTALRLKVDFDYKVYKDTKKRPHIILFNHQSSWDQFLVGMSFRGPLYYVATEDIFSGGLLSKLLKWSLNPIPFKKSTNDLSAVRNCLKVVKEGGSIIMAPEGNRTYSGKTCYIKPSVVKLIRVTKAPVILYNITGGYGIQPRWANKIRKGKYKGEIKRIIEFEEYSKYSDEEFYKIICDELYVNDNLIEGTYKSKNTTEYMERVIYVCPKCGITHFHSDGNIIKCENCGMEVEYLNNKQFEEGFQFKNVGEWYDYQENFINNLDLTTFGENVIFEDNVKFFEVIPYKKKNKISMKSNLKCFNDRLEIKTENNEIYVFKFDDYDIMSVLGKNKFNFYYQDKIYQVKSFDRFNALKYVNIFYRYQNVNKKGENDESRNFLGL